jgi:hypothetical protein
MVALHTDANTNREYQNAVGDEQDSGFRRTLASYNASKSIQDLEESLQRRC